MTRSIIAAALFLTACGTAPKTPPAVELRTVTKTVEVQRPCPVAKPARPERLARPVPVDPVQLAAVLALKLAEWAGPGGYGERADAALTTCITP